MNINKLDALIAQTIETSNLKTKSFIITIFGDLVNLYGGAIKLIHLVEICKLFGISQSLIRTAVFRMKQENLLTSLKYSNTSLYSFSDEGQLLFKKAEKNIYYRVTPENLDIWTLVLTSEIKDKSTKQTFHKELIYQGFTELNSKMLCYPKKSYVPIESARHLKISDQVITFRSTLSKSNEFINVKKLIKRNWNLNNNIKLYRDFIEAFNKIKELIAADMTMVTQKQALMLRLLIIHEYRKVILKDPLLPNQLLPSYWPYSQSYELCAELYQQLYQLSCHELDTILDASPKEHNRFIATDLT